MRSLSARFSVRPFASIVALILTLLLTAAAQARQFAPAIEIKPQWNTTELIQGSQQVLALSIIVPEGYHAQSATPSSEDYIALTAKLKEPPASVQSFPAVYPAGKDETYPALGTLNVYQGTVIVYLPVTVAADAVVGSTLTLKGSVNAQLCDDSSCFPPKTVTFEVSAPVVAAGTAPHPADPALFAGFDWSKFGASAPATSRPSDQAEQVDATVVGSFFGALVVGLIFNVMPCVLPVLPLKAVGFIQAAEKSRGKSILLGLMFSAGLVAIFALLGVAIFGWHYQWGFLFMKDWFVYGMSAILVFMALSQWGLYTFSLPMGVYSFEPRHDTLSGNFLFGGLTALLSTPCTAYVLPALLAWGIKQPPLVGVLLLCTVGVGMAVPYFLMSCFPGLARKIPRTGPWSEIVKQMMGFLILATAAYFVSTKLLKGNQYMWPVAAIAVFASGFLVFRTGRLMPRIRPIAIAAIAAVLISAGTLYAAVALNAPTVQWIPYSQQALADARNAKQTVLIDFTANWCANCHAVERTVFGDKTVQKALLDKKIVLLQVDITNEGAPGSDLLTSLNPAGGIPLTAIYTPGKDAPAQLGGLYTSSTLLKLLD